MDGTSTPSYERSCGRETFLFLGKALLFYNLFTCAFVEFFGNSQGRTYEAIIRRDVASLSGPQRGIANTFLALGRPGREVGYALFSNTKKKESKLQ